MGGNFQEGKIKFCVCVCVSTMCSQGWRWNRKQYVSCTEVYHLHFFGYVFCLFVCRFFFGGGWGQKRSLSEIGLKNIKLLLSFLKFLLINYYCYSFIFIFIKSVIILLFKEQCWQGCAAKGTPCTVGGIANCYSHCGKQYGGSSKD